MVSEPLRISSVWITTAGGHDHVRVRINGQTAGTLVVDEGRGKELAALLSLPRVTTHIDHRAGPEVDFDDGAPFDRSPDDDPSFDE